MIIKQPFIITSRPLPGFRFGDATLSLIDPNALSTGQARVAHFVIDSLVGWTNYDSIGGGGAAKFKGPVAAFSTFLSFLLAAVEGLEYEDRVGRPGENADLFPRHVVRWALDNKSEIEMAHADMCDENGVPNEDLIGVT